MNKIFRNTLTSTAQKSLLMLMLLVAGINMKSGATITVTKASSSICTNYASTSAASKWTALGTMTIQEGANADLGNTNGAWTVSIVLAAPTGWQFNTAVSPTMTNTSAKNVTSVTLGTFTSTSVTINIAGNKWNKADEVMISGLQVQPTITSAAGGDVVVTSITGVATGITAGTVFATLTPSSPVAGVAGVTVSASPSGAICAGTSVAFTAAVTNGGATPAYQWQLNGSDISGATSSTYSSSAPGNGNRIACSVISYSCISTPTAVSATQTMTVNALPAAIAGPNSVCTGSAVTYTNTTPGGTWSSSNTDVASVGASTGVITGMTAGTATITYNTGSGCTATKLITVNAAPAGITGTGSVCVGLTTSLSSTTGGTWSSSATGIATVGSTTGVVTGVAAGNATITLTASNGCAATTIVTVNTTPGNITGASVCAGSTATLTNPVAGGTWSSSNGAVATVSAGGVVSGVSGGVVTITYTLSAGCAATTPVTVNAAADVITGTTLVCEGATTALANAVAGGTWSSSNTAVATIDVSTGVVTGVAAGTAIVTYAIPAGCPAVTTVTVGAMPAAITGTAVVCRGSNVTLSSATAGGVWSSSTSSVATVNAAGIVTGVDSGVTMITYATPMGCQVTYPVTVNALPQPILGDKVLCLGVSTLYYADSTPGGTWSTADASVATIASTGGLTGVSAGVTTISYTLASGCFVTAPVTVTTAVAPITGTATVCVGSSTTLGSSMPGGVWSSKVPAYATIDSTTGVVTGVQAAPIPITYSFGSSCYTVRSVTVNPLPGLSIGGVNWVCAGATTSLSNPVTGGIWTSSDATIATTSPLSATWTSVAGVAAGTATITYTLPTGCYRAKDVTVNPVAPISGPSVICLSEPLTFTNAIGGGTWLSSNPSLATAGYTTGVVTGLAGASVTITYTTPAGCSSMLPVTVSRTSPISGPATACVGNTITLTNSIAGGTWSSSDASVAAASGTAGVVTGVSSGVAVITYTNAAGCNKTQIITVNASPAIITGADAVCAGVTIALSDTVAGGSWTSSTPTIASVDGTGVVSGIAANHTVTVSYTLPSGCRSTKVVSVNATPATISGAAAICQGTTSNYTNVLTGGLWSTSNVAVATISSTGVVTAAGSGAVVITYAMPTGCYQTKELTINPIAPIAGDSIVCVGSTATVANAVAGGAWSTSFAAYANITSEGVLSGVAAGTAVVTYSTPSGCRATRMVTVGAQPSITGTAVACAGLTTTLASPVPGGTWSSSNTVIADVDPATGIVTGNTPGNAAVNYVSILGCSASKVVTINAYPSAISGSSTVCMGSTITLGNTVSGGSWITTVSGVATVSAAGEVTGVAAGTTNISYTTGAGCVVGKTVTVNPISAITGTTSACLGMTTTLSCASTGGTWSSSNAAIAPISSAGIVNGVSAGTAVVTYAIPSGCARTIVVSVNPAATAITGAVSLCAGFSSTLAGNAAGGTWTSSNAAIATVGSATGVVSGVAGGTAVMTYTSGLNCRISTAITVNASAVITGTQKVCIGATTTLASTTTGGVWGSGSPSVVTIDAVSGVVTGVAAGTSIITYSPVAGCGRTAVVTVNPLPVAISGTLNACIGSTSVLTDATPGGVSFTSSNPSIVSIGATSGVVTGIATGTAMITYLINTGCVSTAVFTVNSLPAAIDGSLFACMGSSTTLSNSTAGGTWASSNASRASVGLTTGVVTGVTAGTFNVTYTLPTGCKASAMVTVNPTSAITGLTSVNSGAMITLSNATTGGAWSTSDGSIATVGASSGVVSGVAGGVVTITYMTAAGCPRTAAITVNAVAGRGYESGLAATQVVQVDVYPNPTNGWFTIKTQNAGVLSVFGIDGKEAGHYLISEGATPVQLPQGLTPGVYMCRFADVNSNTTIVRLVYQP